MPCRYDYAVIRVVPRVDREEFINVGILLSCEAQRLLSVQIELDAALLATFAPSLDLDQLRQHLDAIPRICAGAEGSGPIGRLPLRARFHWLTATRSSIVQTSPVHSGICGDPSAVMERLLRTMVRRQA